MSSGSLSLTKGPSLLGEIHHACAQRMGDVPLYVALPLVIKHSELGRLKKRRLVWIFPFSCAVFTALCLVLNTVMKRDDEITTAQASVVPHQ